MRNEFFKSKIRNRISLNAVNSLIHIKYGPQNENFCCENINILHKICAIININWTYENSNYYIKSVLYSEDEQGSLNEDNVTFNYILNTSCQFWRFM